MTGPPARPNRLKDALAAGEQAVAMWVTSPWTAVPEILAASGVDGVLVDLEHTSAGLADAEAMIVAADAARISALVRVPGIDPATVSRVLDAGAHGIVFPHVDSAADAELAARCMLHPPAGVRGWGGAHTRHAMWQGGYAADLIGSGAEPGVYTPEYVARARADVLAVMLVETTAGVDAIAEIAAVDGVDAVIFGWGDYSVEVGFDAARCDAAAARVHEACREAGVGVALTRDQAFYPGSFRIAGVDSLLMSAALGRAVERARASFG